MRSVVRSRAARAAGSALLLIPMLSQAVEPASAAASAVKYTYDAAGRLSTVTDTSGETATYHYDAEGNVLSIAYSSGAGSGARSTKASMRRPSIASIQPTSVSKGEAVTITGSGFSADAAYDVVRVGKLLAPVTSASSTRITFMAPPDSGGAVTVQTTGGSATGPKLAIAEPTSAGLLPPGRNLRPLMAAGGVTAISGLVEDSAGHPLPGVRLRVTGANGGATQGHAVSDGRGLFLISGLAAGRHQLVIDGSHMAGSKEYGLYAEPVQLTRGRTTVLPWVTYLTPLAATVSISSPTTSQVVLTNPTMPGLKIVIPKGTVIHDYYGHVVRAVSLTALTAERTPFPWAPDMVPPYYSLQPGDATVSGAGVQVVYPNYSNQPPGSRIPYLIDSPDWAGTGWWQYGSGTVTPDGREIVPNPGTAYRKFLPGGWGIGFAACALFGICPSAGGKDGGEPVDLGTGLYMDGTTDLALPDIEGVNLTRTYRQLDDDIYDFGRGMSDSLNLYIQSQSNGDFYLFLPDSSYIAYAPTSTTGIYDAVSTPTGYSGSTLTTGGTDPDGPFTVAFKDGTTMAFGNPAFLTKLTDRFGNSLTIDRIEGTSTANGGGQIQKVVTSGGRWIEFTYGLCISGSNPSYCVTQLQDNSGRIISYSYDQYGRLIEVAGPGSGHTSYTWAPCSSSMSCSEMLTSTDPDGHLVISNTYDPTSGRVVKQAQGNGGTWSYGYQTNGSNQVTETDWTNPLGTKYSMTFNANGYPASQTVGAGTSSAETTTYLYDAATNLLTSTTDPLGRTTSYTYDSVGNELTETYLSGTTKSATYKFTYDPVYSRISSFTDPLGHEDTVSYNASAQTVTVTDAQHQATTVTLNNEGEPISSTDPMGNTTDFSYLHGDLVAVADPLGRVTTTYFGAAGQPLQVTDPMGNATNYTWTPLNEEASQTDPLGDMTSFRYDADGNLTSITDAGKHVTQFAYNVMSNVIKQVDPLGNTDSYTYDKLGDLRRQSDGNGTVTDYTYNRLDMLSGVRYGVSGSTDQSTISYRYDAANRLTEAADSSAGIYRFTYDGRNDVVKASSPQGTVSYKYDSAGLRTSLAVPGQDPVGYSYSSDNLLTGLTQGAAKVVVGYNADGLETSMTLPDGITQKNGYDRDSELKSLDYLNGATQVGALDYGYNADGLISSVSGSLESIALPPAVTSAVYNADNEISTLDGTGYTYDKDGNLLSNGTDSYKWNDRGELASTSGASTATFTYDPLGRNSTSTVGGTATSYLYDGGDLVQELSGAAPVANFLTDGAGDPLQMTTPSGVDDSYLSDAIGSTVALANASGQIATSYSYDPKGAVAVSGASSLNPFEFAGAPSDGAGLYSMGARQYSSTTGTFISRDPTGVNGGTTDLYSYAEDDPVNLVDPSGLAARKHHRPYRVKTGKGSQPTPSYGFTVIAGVAGSGSAPAPQPSQGDSTSGGATGDNGGGGGNNLGVGTCYTISWSLIIAHTYSQCIEHAPNGENCAVTSGGYGVAVPGVSAGDSGNMWTGNCGQLGGSSTSCSAGIGEGPLGGNVGITDSNGAYVYSAGGDVGLSPGVSGGCYRTTGTSTPI